MKTNWSRDRVHDQAEAEIRAALEGSAPPPPLPEVHSPADVTRIVDKTKKKLDVAKRDGTYEFLNGIFPLEKVQAAIDKGLTKEGKEFSAALKSVMELYKIACVASGRTGGKNNIPFPVDEDDDGPLTTSGVPLPRMGLPPPP